MDPTFISFHLLEEKSHTCASCVTSVHRLQVEPTVPVSEQSLSELHGIDCATLVAPFVSVSSLSFERGMRFPSVSCVHVGLAQPIAHPVAAEITRSGKNENPGHSGAMPASALNSTM